MYQNMGRPFAAWLTTVLDRQVRGWLRSRKPSDEITEGSARTGTDPRLGLSNQVVDSLNRGLDELNTKCRLYLSYRSEGLKPREIADALGLPDGENKRVSDDLRHCMSRLRDFLLSRGIRPDEVAPK
jgi:DNA-directed RNA polymerase specialized sigma24 family protein